MSANADLRTFGAWFAQSCTLTDSAPKSLQAISAVLDQVCESVALSPSVPMEAAEHLLKLDTIAQSLRRLATGKPFWRRFANLKRQDEVDARSPSKAKSRTSGF